MMRYSVQPRDRIFVKSYGYLPFVKNMGRNIGKNLMKNLSGKCSKKLIHYAKQSATNAFKTASKRAIQETGEESGDVIGNIAKLQKFQKTSKQDNSDTVTNEHNKEIPKERYTYLQKKVTKILMS